MPQSGHIHGQGLWCGHMSMPRPFLALAVGAGLCLANLPGVSAARPAALRSCGHRDGEPGRHANHRRSGQRALSQLAGQQRSHPRLHLRHRASRASQTISSSSPVRNQGVLDDNLPPNFSTTPTGTYPFTTPNLGAEIIAAGFTFAGYCEELESAGATDWADYDPHSATHPGITYHREAQPVGELGGQGAAAPRRPV